MLVTIPRRSAFFDRARFVTRRGTALQSKGTLYFFFSKNDADRRSITPAEQTKQSGWGVGPCRGQIDRGPPRPFSLFRLRGRKKGAKIRITSKRRHSDRFRNVAPSSGPDVRRFVRPDDFEMPRVIHAGPPAGESRESPAGRPSGRVFRRLVEWPVTDRVPGGTGARAGARRAGRRSSRPGVATPRRPFGGRAEQTAARE